MAKVFPILSIEQFDDYNHCHHCANGFYIREFNKHLQDNQFLDKPHGHNFYIVLLVTEGAGLHYIDMQSYEICPGSLFIIVPGQIHNWDLSEDVNGYILFFTKEYLLSEYHSNQLSKLPFFYSHFAGPSIQVRGSLEKKLIRIFKELDGHYAGKERFSNDLIRLYLKILLLEIEKEYAESISSYSVSHQQSILNKFEEMVEGCYKEHFSIAVYADRLNISIKQLTTLCKRFLNKPPGELIQERIVLEAKRLLIHTNLPVFSIAETLNYTDPSYFIRLFKKATNYTPEQYRNKNSIEPSPLKIFTT